MSSAPLKMRRLKRADQLRERIETLGIDLPFDERVESGADSPLGQSLEVDGRRIGNRFVVLPMEGWDGTRDGAPTDLVTRRWQRFGASGAKLVWGGEAVAVRRDGRANPNQLVLDARTARPIARLREELVASHEAAFGSSRDLVVGLQLTHSGRWSRPEGPQAPRIAYRHPILDARVGVGADDAVLSDDELDALVEDFVAAAVRAREAGFDFVDVKHCHGYLGHELLSGVDRPGRYGGDLEGRTRFLRSVIDGIRDRAPDLMVGVRLSAFDVLPFRAGETGTGVAEPWTGAYPYAFGGDGSGAGIDLSEPSALLDTLQRLGVRLVCVTAGSPYYNPHVQRPAFFPPSDGYQPPEDPLVGVARQLGATAELTRRHPELVIVGSGYSYLQEWLPNVAQRSVREGRAHAVGLGRMVLSYPGLPADVLAGKPLAARLLCRTFSDCTTAPRNGLVSGCYPLDDFYKERPEADALAKLKKA